MRFLGMGAAIHIFNPQRSSEEIYATTIHELAHAVHWDMSSSDYNNSEDIVSESWSVGVQWALTKMTYQSYLGRRNGTASYTNLIMDLIDSYGQETFDFGTTAPTDLVQDYNITQIQDALYNVRNLEAWKNNLFYQYENTTESNLDTLFLYWYNN